MQYVVCVEFSVDPAQKAEFMALLMENAKATLENETGCLLFDVCVDERNASEIFLYEVYRNKAAFADHLETAHFKNFDIAVGDMVKEKQVRTFVKAN